MEHVLSLFSKWLIKHEAIKPNDRELYEYAIYSFLISIVPLVIFMVTSGAIGMLQEAMLIVVPFIITRKFSGGYHAKHAYVCLPASAGLLVICLYVVVHVRSSWILCTLFVIGGISIVINSPIDSENRKLSRDEMKEYKRMTCMIVTFNMLLYMVFIFFGAERYSICLAVSLMLTALLQAPCILRKRLRRNRAHI